MLERASRYFFEYVEAICTHLAGGDRDPASGIAGMAASHDQARAARRVADLLGVRPRTVVRYGTVALTALLTLDPSEGVRFAVSQLGD